MRWETWSLFVATEAVLSLTPGPAVLMVLSQALKRGCAKSIWSSLGILSANAFYFVLSATSLGAVLLASYHLFFAIKWIGAAYLIYLGVSAFFSRTSLISPSMKTSGGAGWRIFLNGFVLQAANPKALLFFCALLPQFVDPAHPIAFQVLILGASSILVEFVILLGYGILAGRTSRFARHPRFAAVTNRVAGSLLIGAGAGLASIRRS
jgi:threonine/homoserine/homoserine lactone efflux protein